MSLLQAYDHLTLADSGQAAADRTSSGALLCGQNDYMIRRAYRRA